MIALIAPVAQSVLSASRVPISKGKFSFSSRIKMRSLIALFHVLQPIARLTGRLSAGLTLWRRRLSGFVVPWPRSIAIWSETWRSPADRLVSLETKLKQCGAHVQRGGEFDNWDLQVKSGPLGAARILLAVEEHGFGKQYARFRVWPRCSYLELVPPICFGLLSLGAAAERVVVISGVFGVLTIFLMLLVVIGCGRATASVFSALRELEKGERDRKP